MIDFVRFGELTSKNQLQIWLAWQQNWMIRGSYEDRIPVDLYEKLSLLFRPYPGNVFRRKIQLSSMVMRKLAMSPLPHSTIACSIMVNFASWSKLWSSNRKCLSDVIGSLLHLTFDRWPLIHHVHNILALEVTFMKDREYFTSGTTSEGSIQK